MERNNKWNDALVALYPNRNGDQSLENAAFEFSDKNWGKLLVISSEFAPRDEVLEWAKNLCTSDKYKNHRVIFLTHSYLKGGAKAERIVSEGYKITPQLGTGHLGQTDKGNAQHTLRYLRTCGRTRQFRGPRVIP